MLLLSNKLILDAACIVCGAGLMKRLSISFFIWQWHAAGLLLSTMQAGDINQQWRVLGTAAWGSSTALSSKCGQCTFTADIKKGKVFPYSLPSVELIPVYRQSACR